MAPARPRSASTGGWIPRTTSGCRRARRRRGARLGDEPLGAPPDPSPPAPRAMPRLIAARPAGPGRRRGGRARCGAARRRSGRALGAGLGQHRDPLLEQLVAARESSQRSSRPRAHHQLRRREPPQHQRHDQQRQEHHGQRDRQPDGRRDQRPRRAPATTSGRRPSPQPAQRVLPFHRPPLGRDGVPEGLGGERAVPVGDPPQHRRPHEHDRDPHHQQRRRPADHREHEGHSVGSASSTWSVRCASVAPVPAVLAMSPSSRIRALRTVGLTPLRLGRCPRCAVRRAARGWRTTPPPTERSTAMAADLITRIPQRAARWSAEHPWRAILTWLVLVVAATSLAVLVPTQQAEEADYRIGQSGRADAMAEQAGLSAPPGEVVLLQSDAGDRAGRAELPRAREGGRHRDGRRRRRRRGRRPGVERRPDRDAGRGVAEGGRGGPRAAGGRDRHRRRGPPGPRGPAGRRPHHGPGHQRPGRRRPRPPPRGSACR